MTGMRTVADTFVMDEGIRAIALDLAKKIEAENLNSLPLVIDGTRALAWVTRNADELLATVGQIESPNHVYYVGVKAA